MNTHPREYRESDLERLMAVWDRASAQAHPFLEPEFVATIREAIPSVYLPNAETWVVEQDGSVVGFISLLGREVGAVFVSPEHQGLGYGRSLLDKAMELRGQLEVEAFAENSIGCDFYRKYGFVVVEEKVHEETGLPLIRFQTK